MSVLTSNKPILKAYTKILPEHKGNRRIWIDSSKVLATPIGKNLSYSYSYNEETKTLTLKSGKDDNRKVTLKKSGIPVIDICNSEISKFYEGLEKVTIILYEDSITIEPLYEEMEQLRAKEKLDAEDITFVDIFSGTGTLSEAMKMGGMSLIAAVELEDKYLVNLERNNPNTFAYNTSVTDMDIRLLPDAVVAVAGIPCEDYSIAGVSKKNSLGVCSREAGLTGSLGFYYLESVKKIRPAACVVEEVVGFANSAMRNLIVSVLQMLGYTVTEKILKAHEYGGMTKRARYCMVATIKKTPFEFPEESGPKGKTVSSILEIPFNDRVWVNRENSRTMAYSLDKEQGHIKKGDGFRLARTYMNDTITATITKGYYKQQLTNPILVHPNDSTQFSWFTPRELARLNGLPDTFSFKEKEGVIVKTVAGELIGQGVAIEPFMAVSKKLTSFLRNSLIF